jgi:hypothetical protein
MGGRRLLTMAVCSAFIALPSTAKAWSWWSGWDSYAECMDYYMKNPVYHPDRYRASSTELAEQRCADKKAEEDEKRRERQETYRIIVLGCRADSVSEEQFAACVALATGR